MCVEGWFWSRVQLKPLEVVIHCFKNCSLALTVCQVQMLGRQMRSVATEREAELRGQARMALRKCDLIRVNKETFLL